jgi:hypothetical protein
LILRYLSRYRSDPVVLAADVRRYVSDYMQGAGYPAPYDNGGLAADDGKGSRRWRRDCADLTERGLIRTGLPMPGGGGYGGGHGERLQGMARVVREKPLDLHFTPEEHAALRWAWSVVGDRIPAPTVGGDLSKLDPATVLLRVLEESEPGQYVTVTDLVRAVGLREDITLNLIKMLAYDPESFGDEWVITEHGDVDLTGVDTSGWDAFDLAAHEEEHPSPVVAATLKRLNRIASMREYADVPSVSPTWGQGLALVGMFAYSQGEVESRLALIDMAGEHADYSTHANDLTSVRDKLTSWQAMLTAWEAAVAA